MTNHADKAAGRKMNRARTIRGWRASDAAEPPREEAHDARTRSLLKLIPLWPGEIVAADAASAHKVVATLERALRAERRRGRAGHWSYDMNRHVALARALREERGRLAELRRATTARAGRDVQSNGGKMETKALTAAIAL